jgi:hypothetical protein
MRKPWPALGRSAKKKKAFFKKKIQKIKEASKLGANVASLVTDLITRHGSPNFSSH